MAMTPDDPLDDAVRSHLDSEAGKGVFALDLADYVSDRDSTSFTYSSGSRSERSFER